MKLEELRVNPDLVKQVALLEAISAYVERDSACLGAAVGGSLAGGGADRMSDVDLLVYCESGTATQVLHNLSVVAQTCPVIYRLNGKHDASSVYEKVVLENWSSYEIHVIEPATRMRLKPPYLELCNRDGYLETRVSEEKPIGRQTIKPLTSGSEGLFWELFNCMKWLRRGDFGFTSQYIQQLAQELSRREAKE